jgi:hypothetical protein
MIINLSNNVADMRALDASPFPLEYRCTTVHVPIVDKANAARIHLSTAHLNMIKEIEALERHFSAASHVTEVPDDNANRHVSFKSHAVGQPMSYMMGNLNSALYQDSLLGKHALFDSPMDNYSDPQSLGDLEMHDNQ